MNIAVFLCLIFFILLNYRLSMTWLKIKRVFIPVKHLLPEFDGLKIMHITDIHNASHKKVSFDFFHKIASLEYDFVVITGDMTRKEFAQVKPLRTPLKELTKKTPVYFVFGNHEYGVEKQMRLFLEEIGVIVLADEIGAFQYQGSIFSLMGFQDYVKHKRDGFQNFKAFLKKTDISKGQFTLVLSHQPQMIDDLPADSAILMLSGHTHGGQVRLPFCKTLFAPNQGFFPQYGDGLYEVKNNLLYISRGIGTTKFPFRFFNRPEIAVITLLC